MAPLTIILRPRTNFMPANPAPPPLGQHSLIFQNEDPQGQYWEGVNNDWGFTGFEVMQSAISTIFKQNEGGAYAAKVTEVRDHNGNLSRPFDLENHVFRATFRNRGPNFAARLSVGVALGGTPMKQEVFTPPDTRWMSIEFEVPASTLLAHLGEPGAGGAAANYNQVHVFFSPMNQNAANPNGTAWTFDVTCLQLVVPDPLAPRYTRVVGEIFAPRSRLAVTRVVGEAFQRSGQRISRLCGEAFVRSHQRVTRVAGEVWVKDQKQIRASRVVGEVFVKASNASTVAATRVAGEAFVKALGANFTRVAGEVWVKRQGVGATRLAGEVFVKYSGTGPTSRITRLAGEAFAKLPFPISSVAPLSLPATLPNLLRAEWGAEMVLESAYATDVTRSAYTASEERRGLVDRPYRRGAVRFVGHDVERVLQATLNAARRGHTRTVLPLYMDGLVIRKQIAADFLGCRPLYRRFFRGQRVVVHGWVNRMHPANAEYAVVRSVNAEGLELATPLVGSFPRGSRVFPLIDADYILSGSLGAMTDDAARNELSFAEVVGPSAMPGIATGDPAEPRHVDGQPILVLSPDWARGIESRIVRYGSQASSGRGIVTGLEGERPVFAHTIPLVFTNRPQFWRVLSFFDTRLGRLRTFWTVWPTSLFTAAAIPSVTTIDLKQSGNLADVQAFIKALAIVRRDGRVSIHRISSMIVDGSNWRVTVVEPIPVTSPSEISRVTVAVFGRLERDSLVERWSTADVCESELHVIELLEEKAVVIPDVVEGTSLGGPDAVAGLFAWFDSGVGLHTSAADMATPPVLRAGKATPGDIVSAWDDVRTPLGAFPCLAGANLAADRAKLIRFDNADLNNNRWSLRFDGGPRYFNLRTSDSVETATPFWDNAQGFTLFVNLRLTGEDTLERKILWRQGIVEWTSKTVTLYETDGGGPVTLTLPAGWAQASSVRTLCLVWKPNDFIKLYSGGGAPVVSETASKIVDLATTAKVTEIARFAGSVAAESPDAFAIGLDPFVNSVILYSRALGNPAINGVGNFLAQAFGAPWSAVS